MTSNQRRPGFRLPWSSETEDGETQVEPRTAEGDPQRPAAEHPPQASAAEGTKEAARDPAGSEAKATAAADASSPAADKVSAPVAAPKPQAAPAADAPPRPAVVVASAPVPETSAGFMRDLVAAMRRVAEETRQAGLSDLRTKAEEHVRTLEANAEQRREELRTRAEADVSGVGEWERAELERIKQDAEHRVVGRRAQLDQQLAAETTRAETETQALRDRVAAYERELDAYHAQLSDIADPAAFAAAAKRMPPPPRLAAPSGASPDAASVETDPGPADAKGGEEEDAAVHPAEEEVLAARLAELDASIDTPTPATGQAETTATEIFVKGLGSFGAITGFRQSLAASEGIDGVSLSLGPTGEFVFRAIHAAGVDVGGAIRTLEGDTAKIEPQPDGAVRVTLERAR